VITKKIRDEDEDKDIENEWKFAAMALDRVCLVLHCVLSFLLTLVVFLLPDELIVP